jgi:hypothetical protein
MRLFGFFGKAGNPDNVEQSWLSLEVLAVGLGSKGSFGRCNFCKCVTV